MSGDLLDRLPAGEAREDEREIEKLADGVQNAEPTPARVVEQASLPAVVTGEDGKKTAILRPDGRPAGIQGQVITTLGAEEAQRERIRILKPCVSCAQAFRPNPKSDLYADLLAHVSVVRQWKVIPEGETAAEYLGCRAHNLWVHASQTCPPDRPFAHVYKKDWLRTLKAFLARRRAAKAARSQQ